MESRNVRTGAGGDGANARGSAAATDVVLQNLDVTLVHRIDVRVSDAGGREVVHKESVRLGSGGSARRRGVLPAGSYHVEVDVDGRRHATDTCEVGIDDGDALLVAVGNGLIHISGTGSL